FVLGQPRRGATYAVLQAAFGAVSIGTFVHLSLINKADNPAGWTQDQLERQVGIRRWAIQWPATLVFYGLWAASHLDARKTWAVRQGRRAEITVQIGERQL